MKHTLSDMTLLRRDEITGRWLSRTQQNPESDLERDGASCKRSVLYRDTVQARLADTRSQVFEARKLKNHPEKLPSFPASWILESSSRLRATNTVVDRLNLWTELAIAIRTTDLVVHDIWKTRDDVKIKNNKYLELDKVYKPPDFSAESLSINWEFYRRPRLVFELTLHKWKKRT